MERSMMQVYVKGSVEAVALYQRAFGAPLGYHVKSEDGSFYHSELDVYGQVLAVAEQPPATESATGTVMQFCLHFGEGGEQALRQAYDALAPGATLLVPLGPCEFSPNMADLIDAFGVRWCLFL